MLFQYEYVDDNVKIMHECMSYLVKGFWCNASGEFDVESITNEKLKDMILRIYRNPQITKDHLYGPIKSIYEKFTQLSDIQKNTISQFFDMNNSIQELFEDKSRIYMDFNDLKQIDEDLSKEIHKFFESIYTDVIHLKDVKDVLNSSMDRHYKKFIKKNTELCPFCGLHLLEFGERLPKEAYDHFLSKGEFPFTSINLKNLAPMCSRCNSSYKLKKNPIAKDAKRVKAFYPYGRNDIDIGVDVSLQTKKIDGLSQKDVNIELKTLKYKEEVESWDRVFRIKDRYKQKVSSKLGAKAWLDEVNSAINRKNKPYTIDEYIELLEENQKANPLSKDYLWEVPFIKECKRKGILRDLQEVDIV